MKSMQADVHYLVFPKFAAANLGHGAHETDCTLDVKPEVEQRAAPLVAVGACGS